MNSGALQVNKQVAGGTMVRDLFLRDSYAVIEWLCTQYVLHDRSQTRWNAASQQGPRPRNREALLL